MMRQLIRLVWFRHSGVFSQQRAWAWCGQHHICPTLVPQPLNQLLTAGWTASNFEHRYRVRIKLPLLDLYWNALNTPPSSPSCCWMLHGNPEGICTRSTSSKVVDSHFTQGSRYLLSGEPEQRCQQDHRIHFSSRKLMAPCSYQDTWRPPIAANPKDHIRGLWNKVFSYLFCPIL